MGIVDLESAAILHMERRSSANCQLEEMAFKGRARTAGNQNTEATSRAVATASEARCDCVVESWMAYAVRGQHHDHDATSSS